MRRKSVTALVSSVLAIAIGMLAVAETASARGRPGGAAVSTRGMGTLGSPWKLKSMHDDLAGASVAGEEFEIDVAAGHTWTTTFADDGVVFFTGDQVSTTAGIREVHAAPGQPGSQHMTVHAVDHTTGETVDGFVDLPPLA